MRYIALVLSALDDLKRDALKAETEYFGRLTESSHLLDAVREAFANGGVSASSRAQLRVRGRRQVELARGVLKAVLLCPVLVWQARLLLRIGGKSCFVIALASNRLSLDTRSASARENLASLVRPMSRNTKDSIAQKIGAADYIVVADALPVSRLWKYRRRCWRENILIVDGAFSVVFGSMALAWSAWRNGAQFLRLVMECYRGLARLSAMTAASRFRKSILYSWVVTMWSAILAGPQRTEAVFLTSNSTLTELLRAYLLQSEKSAGLTEVMHGIGSIQAERFFDRALSGAEGPSTSGKLRFIPQIPNLPLYGVFRKYAPAQASTAINAYLNQYLISRDSLEPGTDGFVGPEYNALRGDTPGAANPLIVTILGHAANDGRIVDSVSFEIERAIAAVITRVEKRLDRGCLTLYVPHPLHKPWFVRNGVPIDGVTICESSVLSWLLSDVCVSLSSSAMFEAASFGIRAFTPMVPKDGIFTERYLDLVSHPKSGSFDEFASDLQDGLIACSRMARVDVVQRGLSRLELMR